MMANGAASSPRTASTPCWRRPGGCWSTTPDVGAAVDLAAGLPGVRLGERGPDRLAVQLDGTAPEPLNRGWSAAACGSASW